MEEEFEFVPLEERTYGVCLAAVKARGRSLEHVPKHLMTPELLHVAAQKSAEFLKYAPPDLVTEELLLTACSSTNLETSVLPYVPEHLQTDDVMLKVYAVVNGKCFLRYLPPGCSTESFYMKFAEKYPGGTAEQINEIPREFRARCWAQAARKLPLGSMALQCLETAEVGVYIEAALQFPELISWVPESAKAAVRDALQAEGLKVQRAMLEHLAALARRAEA